MAQNKTQPTRQSVAAFLAGVADEGRRRDAKTVVRLMQSACGEKPKLWGPSIVGFGSHHYVYASGREGDTPVVAFSPRKAALALYGITGFDGADRLLARLGTHTTGKGCLYIKRLDQVDVTVLEEMVRQAVASRSGL